MRQCTLSAYATFVLHRYADVLVLAKMQNTSQLSLMVAAGGTGGDLFPVLSIIERVRTLCAEAMRVDVAVVGNPNRIEGRIIPAQGYRFIPVPMRGYYGLRSWRTYGMLWRLPISLARVWRVARRMKPHVAVLAGTYLSVPLGIVARLAGIPIVLVEINAAPGKVNRLLARWAWRILVSYPECAAHFSAAVQSRIVVTGTPVRSTLYSLPEVTTARQQFGFDPARPVLLVLGGSLGARSINRAMERYAEQICAQGWQILWQTGEQDQSSAPQMPAIRRVPFIDDMAAAYAACELVISRAGGSTVAELAITQRPAILVPYPHAANKEQHKNAALLAARGGAVVCEDSQLSDRLWDCLLPLLRDAELRRQMARALGRDGRPDAASAAAQIVLELATR
jgi:UDP-N-acetylglucosamine--N-acetylmuramyl-(pentapeptide) pyrophosphoryl-undecaprenol N-acetylglucosamine transferase